ncbi:PREDICTED: uncharacterized protein LOC105951263 [Erythranthe guttata]|uniref:uncharacterized protein LOC105951263 n=1 Tax=Erythranthe guttata TaxID=4155 RepID=UPI00064DD6E6|nr:PREDICTED: uncharacterized protein LOC105951263 [Erythranthe guttata]|eukprot:XP_012830116.1 PREDICTED: uncharacterized protein LOC105951263 [Erythranthe guttata]
MQIMEQKQDLQSCLVLWRGRKLVVEMNPSDTLRDLGKKLQELTNIEADTLRLLIPTEKSSKLIYPFSDDHSCLTLDSTSLLKVKSIRMMGVPKDEVDEVLKNAKADLRIAGFDEEEKRMKQRNINRSYSSPKLPQGTYVFCDFRTLSLPGVELDPPASKALELLHKLASDPGIVAIMNKHRWRVGILTEMAPIGYVGVSPKCILGFNQNHGEEISLRLRTDDLKGFRKYGSIKKTLLHELAHMVFSEHDSNFYALDSQLNKEAANLDWTRSRGHTLSGVTNSQHYEDEFDSTSNATPSQKIGGQASALPNARAASVSAAFERLANSFTTFSSSSEMDVQELGAVSGVGFNQNVSDDNKDDESMDPRLTKVPLPVASENDKCEQSNPNKSRVSPIEPNFNADIQRKALEPELVDSGEEPNHRRFENTVVPDQRDSVTPMNIEFPSHGNEMQIEPDSGEPIARSQTAEPEPNDPELQIIQDPVTVVLGRLQSAVQSLKYQVTPSETGRVLQTLIKIIRNVIEHPDDVKFKKLRKANPTIQMNILTYKAAMDILTMIGFVEDVIVDEWGKADAFLMLKRNDPGLLWLAKSSLETYIT